MQHVNLDVNWCFGLLRAIPTLFRAQVVRINAKKPYTAQAGNFRGARLSGGLAAQDGAVARASATAPAEPVRNVRRVDMRTSSVM